jgi:NADH dehydrogenase FAD-containing subunit
MAAIALTLATPVAVALAAIGAGGGNLGFELAGHLAERCQRQHEAERENRNGTFHGNLLDHG